MPTQAEIEAAGKVLADRCEPLFKQAMAEIQAVWKAYDLHSPHRAKIAGRKVDQILQTMVEDASKVIVDESLRTFIIPNLVSFLREHGIEGKRKDADAS